MSTLYIGIVVVYSSYYAGIYLTALMCITAMSTTAHVVADKLVASPRIRKEVPYLVNKVYKLCIYNCCCSSLTAKNCNN